MFTSAAEIKQRDCLERLDDFFFYRVEKLKVTFGILDARSDFQSTHGSLKKKHRKEKNSPDSKITASNEKQDRDGGAGEVIIICLGCGSDSRGRGVSVGRGRGRGSLAEGGNPDPCDPHCQISAPRVRQRV